MRKRGFWKVLVFGIMFALVVCGTAAPVSAADAGKQIIISPGTDVQPFIRQFLHNTTFSSGGPFTVRLQVKIEGFKKQKPTGKVYVNIWDNSVKNAEVIKMCAWTKDMDWTDVTTTAVYGEYGFETGKPVMFQNINKILISGQFQPYALLDMGILYGTGTASFRNLEIYDAAGKLRYSWATDPDLKGLSNLKMIGGAEPRVMACTFGDGSGVFQVADSVAEVLVTTENPAEYEATGTQPSTETTKMTSVTTAGESKPFATASATPTTPPPTISSDSPSVTTLAANTPDEFGSALWWGGGIAAVVIVAAGIVSWIFIHKKKNAQSTGE